ncbi:hypothetical protein PVAND_012828 [Polypedilum vanderplanki]|uniref:Uncharacterized protein n=1 Tax=Polypedilum vanderplanki TaxID=319348 RepID=A0A9J6CPK8_POLVA|nr:hypothetical protein PVAND_012828 [Polypedilum vanderplanki]
MFAAYNTTENKVEKVDNNEFLQNKSFESSSLLHLTSTSINLDLQNISSASDTSSSSSDEEDNRVNKKQKLIEIYPSTKVEGFYEDKEPRKEYLKMESLPKRALPFYHTSRYRLTTGFHSGTKKFKRYFSQKKSKKRKKDKKIEFEAEDDKEEELRLYLTKNQNDVEKWIEYIDMKELMSPLPSDQTEKSKLELIEKAMHFNPNNRSLIELYLLTIPKVHTSDIVVNLIMDLIARDQYNIFYWKHYVKNSINSMSCNAENGMKCFEKAMNAIQKSHDSDHSMLQLFKMCCLFLRQAGLNEQFFGVIHLMIRMNIKSSDDFDKIFYTKEIQNSYLAEYEELLLNSELPMNELWYRMETIRSICNFLPVRVSSNSNQQMQDPQRYVFTEDICNLVFPLKNSRAYTFDLFVLTLKLLKFPMPYYDIKNEIFTTDDNEIEDGMIFLSVLLENPIGSINFNSVFFSIIKDLNISPNYLSFNVEYEPYMNCIFKIIESCQSSFTEKQNLTVLILWLRLQRLLITIDELKLKTENKQRDPNEIAKYKKQIKSRVKNILKSSKYQNNLNIYIEYAKIEAALGDNDSSDKIFNMAINAAKGTRCNDLQSELDYYQIVLEYCERKLLNNEKDECLLKLKELTGDCDSPLRYLTEKLDETRDEISDEIEDYFLPKSNRLNVIKAKVFLQLLMKGKKIALNEISNQIEKTKDNSLLREKLYEFYIRVYHLKISDEMTNAKIYIEILSKGLTDFPKNHFIMHAVASQSSFRWFDLRRLLLLNKPTSESIFYLNAASKYREEKFIEDDTKIYKHRLFNTINALIYRKKNDVSSILTWRLYLRAAFNYDFTRCKRILYEVIDANPMIKQLYLDGSRLLPEEHSHLHDMIIEKGLRIHTIVEELEILRSNSIN